MFVEENSLYCVDATFKYTLKIARTGLNIYTGPSFVMENDAD